MTIRSLSVTETFYAKFDVSIVTVCHIQGPIHLEVLRQAIKSIQMRHPYLNCIIQEQQNALYFQEKPGLNLDIQEIICSNVTQELPEAIQQMLNTPLDTTQGLFYARLIQQSSDSESPKILLTALHHSIADGLCTLSLHQEILEATASILAGKLPKIASPLSAMPPLENFIPKEIDQEALDDYIARYIDAATAITPQALSPQHLDAKPEDLSVSLVQRQLQPDQTLALINLCKAKKTTVHGAICAAHLLAIRTLIDDSNTPLTLCCHSPVDVRSRLEPPVEREHLFSAAIGCGSCHEVSPSSSLWELGQEVTNTIKSSIETQDIFKGVLTFDQTRAKYRLATAIGVTNVGVLDIPTQFGEGLELKAISFIPSYKLPMLGVAVTTFNQHLILNYPFTQPYYDEGLMNTLADRVYAYLTGAALV
jgi:NRPS condensation-like uncharacterized protein